jgi:hypothetical protein
MIGFARGSSHEKSSYRYQARLWIFGDAVGAAPPRLQAGEGGIAALAAGSQLRPAGVERRPDGYRCAKSHGESNSANSRKSRQTRSFAFSGRSRRQCVYARFIAILKLPFKFDRS